MFANFHFRSLLTAWIFSCALSTFAGQLHSAIEAGDNERVKSTIAADANMNAPDIFSCTPLMMAAYRNQIVFAEALLNAGANVNQWNGSGTALHATVLAGHEPMFDFLIEAGADTNSAPGGGQHYITSLLRKASLESRFAAARQNSNYREKSAKGQLTHN